MFESLLASDIPLKHGTLPSDYTQLEYIEGTGTQYIDTGLISGKFVHDIEFTNTSRNLMGSSVVAGYYWGSASGGNEYEIGLQSISLSTQTRRTVTYDNRTSTCSLTCEGTTVTQTRTGALTVNYHILHINSSTTYYCSTKLYGFKAYDTNDVLVANFIPAKRNSDSVIGMYDTITNSFFINQGTGDFTAGAEIDKYPLEIPKVSYDNNAIDYTISGNSSQSWVTIDDVQYKIPDGYTVLNYIESSGTQYIDLGYTRQLTDTISVEYQITTTGTSSTPNKAVIGDNNSDPQTVALYAWDDKMYLKNMSSGSTTAISSDRNKHTLYFDTDGKVYQDGTLVKTVTVVRAGSSNLALFSRGASGVNIAGGLRIFKCIVGSVRKMIPMKRNSDSVAGMYDFVNNVFYVSASSTAFVGGTEGASSDRPVDIVNVGDLVTDSSSEHYGEYKIPVKVNDTLPSDYTRLEYIEGTGTQYINTGVIPNQDTSFELDIMFTEMLSGNYGVFGNYSGNAKRYEYLLQTQLAQNGEMGYYDSYQVTTQKTPLVIDTYYKIEEKKNLLYINDTLEHTFNTGTFSCDGVALLFAFSQSTGTTPMSSYSPAKAKVYQCKIWDDATLVRNFIPAKRNSDNEIGMYDVTNDVFYTNQGTNSFVAGGELGTTIYLNNPLCKTATASDYLFWGKGENLYDGTITNWAYTSNYVTSNSTYRGITLPVEEGKTYTFKRSSVPETASSNRFVYYFTTEYPYNGLTVYNVTTVSPNTSLNRTFTVPSGMKYVVFYFDISGHDISGTQMMLVEGSTVPTTYQSYALTPKVVRNIKKVTLSAGTHTLSDAMTNSPYICTQQASGTLSGQVLTLDTGVSNADVYYVLATSTTETAIDLPALPLKAGTDNITVNTTTVPSEMDVKAWCWRW